MDAPRVRKRPAGWSPPPWPTPSSSLNSLRGSLSPLEKGGVEEKVEQREKSGKPKKKKRKLHNSRLCPWENCEKRVDKSDNALFDHIVEVHILSLKGEEQRQNNEKDKEDKKSDEGKQETEEDESDSDSEADPYSCRWPDCGMSLQRGDEDRKIDWLEVHLHSRHIQGAGRFRCSKCSFRAKTKKLVGEHEKKCGKAEKKKREPRASPLLFYHPADPRPPPPRKSAKAPVKPADCFQYAHVRAPKKHPLLADFDPVVDVHFRNTIMFKMQHDWNVRRELNPAWKDTTGSAWRKSRLPGEAYRFVVIDKDKEAEERKEQEKMREEAEIPFDDLPQSLDELFPAPPGYPSQTQLKKLGGERAERVYLAADVAHERWRAEARETFSVPARLADADARGRLAIVRPRSASGAPLPVRAEASATDAYGSVPYSPLSICTADEQAGSGKGPI